MRVQVQSIRPLLTSEQVKAHLQAPKVVDWVSVASLGKEVPESCVDGRGDKAVIGTAGGNVGLFIEAIAAYEQVSGQFLQPHEITQFFYWFVGTFGKFYLHTDTHAVAHLQEAIEHDPRFGGMHWPSKSAFRKDLLGPSKYKEEWLEHIVDYHNIGCGHLKAMLWHSDQYKVRSGVVRNALRVFYRSLWGYAPESVRKNLTFVILEGDHKEGAVVQVLVKKRSISEKTLVPTVRPMLGETQMFVVHPQVETYMRRKTAEVIVQEQALPGLKRKDSTRFVDTMTVLGADFLRETVSRLALGLPVYAVTLSQ